MQELQDQHRAIVQAFKLIDKSGDGHISQAELLAFCKDNGSFLDHLQLDTQRRGAGKGDDLEYKVEALLSLLDVNSNGSIEVDELERALTGRLSAIEDTNTLEKFASARPAENDDDGTAEEEQSVVATSKSRDDSGYDEGFESLSETEAEANRSLDGTSSGLGASVASASASAGASATASTTASASSSASSSASASASASSSTKSSASAVAKTPMSELEKKLARQREKIRKAEQEKSEREEDKNDEKEEGEQRSRGWTTDAIEAEAERMRDWEAAARNAAGAEYDDDDDDDDDDDSDESDREQEKQHQDKEDDLYQEDENITELDAVNTDVKQSANDFAAGVAAAEVQRINEHREKVS